VELVGAASFDQGTLDSLGGLLALSVGPIARHLVKRAAQQAKGVVELVRQLSESIPHPADRAKFLAQAERFAHVTADTAPAPPPRDKEVAPTWDAAWLDKVRKELAAQMGPMARVLVDRAARQARSRKELCELLSAELPEGQRKRFFTALGIAV
jgi:serine/threonine-protein kinase